MRLKRIGIVGCGRASVIHINAIEANQKFYKLVALCDSNPTTLKKVNKNRNVLTFTSYEEMLNTSRGKMDIVVIATPNSFHYRHAIMALESRYDVLIEKPVSFKKLEVLKIDKKANFLGKKAYAVLPIRYNPAVCLLKQIIKNNFLGNIRLVSLTQRWQRPKEFFSSWHGDIKIGGRILYDIGIHYLDIMQWIFGSPKVLFTKTFNLKHEHIPFEDTVFSILNFENGAAGSIEISTAAEPSNLECSLFIIGEKGSIKLGGKTLDKIEYSGFTSNHTNISYLNAKIEKMNQIVDKKLEKCSSMALLYGGIIRGNFISLEEASKSIGFIENIYKAEK